jgi:hypothetical protein
MRRPEEWNDGRSRMGDRWGDDPALDDGRRGQIGAGHRVERVPVDRRGDVGTAWIGLWRPTPPAVVEWGATRVAGADVWKGKRIPGVVDDQVFHRALIAPEIVTTVTELDDCAAIGMVMPIDLPTVDHSRPTAKAARVFGGPRRSSVMPIPPAELLICASAADASHLATGRKAAGHGVPDDLSCTKKSPSLMATVGCLC